MKKYLLVLYGYNEEETHLYDSIDELLNNWDCESLSDLFEDYKSCDIYCVVDKIDKDNYKTKEVTY